MKSFAQIGAVCVLGILLSGCETLSGMMPSSLLSGLSGDNTADDIDIPQPTALSEFKPGANVQTRWQVNTGQRNEHYVRIHPYVADNAVVVAGKDSVSAWDSNTGAPLWQTTIGEPITGGVNGGDGLVFVGTAEGTAVALKLDSGKVAWGERLNSEILAVSNVDEDRVVFRGNDGRLSTLATDSGELLWAQTRPTPALSMRGAGVPIVVGGLVVAGFDNGTVTAYELKTGRGVWEAVLSVPRGGNELERITDVDGHMKVVGSALFAVGYEGQVAGINMADGRVAWGKTFASRVGLDADDQGVYTADRDGNIWRLNPQSGNPIWKMDDFQRRSPTAPVLQGEYIVVGDFAGYLHWITAERGQMAARVRSDEAGYTVPPVVSGNTVYSFGKSGILAAHSIQ